MKKNFLIGLAALFLLVGMVGNAYATTVTFFGEDQNGGRVNADAAHNDFMSNLVGVGTEDFEGFEVGNSAPLALDFGVAGTATLNGSGVIQSGYNVGRWATSGDKYWETNSDFTISFSTAISAFGFYGTDIGDFGGEVILNYTNGETKTLGIGNTIGAKNASVLYFGFYEDNEEMAFDSISFSNTNGSDWFGFDDMTIGVYEQINTVPEPSTVLLVGVGLVGLVGYSRKKLTPKS